MSYDSDRDGSWSFDAAYERDFSRESSPIGRVPRQLDPRGSVRISYVCPSDVHEQMKQDAKVWSEMGMHGEPKYMPAYGVNADGEQLVLELRTCSCGSTLAMEVPATTEAALSILRREGLI